MIREREAEAGVPSSAKALKEITALKTKMWDEDRSFIGRASGLEKRIDRQGDFRGLFKSVQRWAGFLKKDQSVQKWRKINHNLNNKKGVPESKRLFFLASEPTV